LNDTFGECAHPKVSWQIDPFGASREMPSLYALMNFDAHVVNRGPEPKGEYIWKASDDLNANIFTTVLHNHYYPPQGFNFEDVNNDLDLANRAEKANDIIKLSRDWNENYNNTNHVMITMGGDFFYRKAENWFSNMDKLIEAVKSSHSDVDIFYSTPNFYIKAVNSEDKTFTERNVDYMSYWVGYYTSRPALKYQDRITNNILQV
jgi:lysosomal alpha-mannosidase